MHFWKLCHSGCPTIGDVDDQGFELMGWMPPPAGIGV